MATYAITLEFDSETLLEAAIDRILGEHHFTRQNRIYFGDPDVTPVSCFLAIADSQTQLKPWFAEHILTSGGVLTSDIIIKAID
jgi:virulence-associated protein VapD